MRLTLVTPPSVHVLDLDTVRRWLTQGVNTTSADPLIENDLIPGVEAMFRAATNRLLMHQHWTVTLRASELLDEVRIPLVPLISVDSVISYSTANVATTLTPVSINYDVEPGEDPTICPAYGCAWPTGLRDRSSLVLSCTCGYGTTMAEVQASRFGEEIRLVLKCLCKYLWDNPGGGVLTSVSGLHDSPDIPAHVKALLASLRVHSV